MTANDLRRVLARFDELGQAWSDLRLSISYRVAVSFDEPRNQRVLSALADLDEALAPLARELREIDERRVEVSR